MSPSTCSPLARASSHVDRAVSTLERASAASCCDVCSDIVDAIKSIKDACGSLEDYMGGLSRLNRLVQRAMSSLVDAHTWLVRAGSSLLDAQKASVADAQNSSVAADATVASTYIRAAISSLRTAQPSIDAITSPGASDDDDDDDLRRVIDSEIDCARKQSDDHGRVKDIPDDFPFEISDKKGRADITLTRIYKGAQIEVLVSPGDAIEYDKKKTIQKPSIGLKVTVSNSDASTLEFTCTVYNDEIVIDALSMRPGDEYDFQKEADLDAYNVPHFDELGENLRKELHKYLELRGITPMTTKSLLKYMIKKGNRENLFWLQKLKYFVS